MLFRSEAARTLTRITRPLLMSSYPTMRLMPRSCSPAICRCTNPNSSNSRNNSDLFAREAAGVLAGNGIRVYFFERLRPTPELSFALRETGSIAGINITASHNPREYNGYKVYWADGAQLPPEHAAQVAESMKQSDIFDDVLTMDFAKA